MHSVKRCLIYFLAFTGVLIKTIEEAAACSVCYGAADSSVIDGMNLSILFMLGLTYSVVVGFVLFFLHLRKKAKSSGRNLATAVGTSPRFMKQSEG